MVWHKTIGTGPIKAVVIHGWFSDHRIFTPIFDALDTGRHSYAFFDIRGYGRSRDVAGAFTIGEVAADAIALADRLGWSDFHVIGHSMGGKAAQKVAMDAPARVKSVVAVTPVPAAALPFDDDLFGVFTKACEDDSTALAVIGEFGRQPAIAGMAAASLGRSARNGAAAGVQTLYDLLHQRRLLGERPRGQGADAGSGRPTRQWRERGHGARGFSGALSASESRDDRE